MRIIYLALLFFVSDSMMAGTVPKTVVQINIDNAITPAMTAYVKDAILYAKSKNASALLITLDTPGGLLDATREMVQAMLAANLPIIVYISPAGARAGSAGVFIALAADIVAMAPSTHIGAAHPVSLWGGDIEGDMKKKIENDSAAWARSLAEHRHRNADWAEKAVRQSVSLSDNQALQQHVADFIAKDIPELLARTQLAGAAMDHFEMSGRQKLVTGLSNANLLYLLLLLGILGLLIEFQFPGVILPGLLGVIALTTVFGIQVLPLNWLGVILILGAIALFIAEIYITSFGILSLGALVLLVLGSYLLFDVPGSTFQVDPIMIWSLALTLLVIFLGFGYLILRAKKQGPTSGSDALKGQMATVYERIIPGQPGTIYIQGAYWAAYGDEEIEPGSEVIIEHMESTHAYVKKISK